MLTRTIRLQSTFFQVLGQPGAIGSGRPLSCRFADEAYMKPAGILPVFENDVVLEIRF